MSLAKEPAVVSPPKAATPTPGLTQAVCTGPQPGALSLGLSEGVLAEDAAAPVLVCWSPLHRSCSLPWAFPGQG